MTEGNNKSGSINFIPAKCPSCGGELRVPANIDLVKCMYCGLDVILRDSSKVIVEPRIDIEKTRTLAKTAESVSNFDEAYRYYTLILEQDPKDSEAWLGKGFTAGMLSSFYNPRTNEVTNYFVKGLSSEEKKIKPKNGRMKFFDSNIIEPSLRKIALTYYGKLINHFSAIDDPSIEDYERKQIFLIEKIGLLAQAYSLLQDDFELVGFIYNKAILRGLIIFDIHMIRVADAVLFPYDNYPRETILEIRKNTATIVDMKLLFDDDLRYDPEIKGLLDDHVRPPNKKDSIWRKLFP